MSFWASLASGGISGLLNGAGELAKDIRTALTGKEPISAEQTTRLLERAAALEESVLNADVAIAQGQIEINKIEAASIDKFRAGWRPATGWVCVAGLFYTFLLRPILPWAAGLFGYPVDLMPPIDMAELMVLLCGMLGLGGFRTFEKVKGLH